MPIYNFALLFDNDFANSLVGYANVISKSFDAFFSLQKDTHVTVVKFGTKKPLSEVTLSKLKKLSKKPLKVNFSGLALVPSHKEGVWVEVSILRSAALIDLQRKVLALIKGATILSSIEDRFRPHVTIALIKNKDVHISSLPVSLLRKEAIAYPRIGLSDKDYHWTSHPNV